MSSSEKTPLLRRDNSELLKPSTSPPRTASWFSSALILANIMLGSGLLNFPNAYKDAGGLLGALMIQAATLVFIEMSIVLMGYCSDISGTNTYQDVVRAMTGKIGLVLSNILIVIHDFGSCVTYLIIVADQVDRVILYFYGPTYCHEWYLNRTFTLTLLSILFILPFIFPKNISSFKFASGLGVLTTMYLFSVIIYKYFTVDADSLPDAAVGTEGLSTWSDIFKVIPVIVFSFDAHIEAVPVYATLKKRNLLELSRTLVCSTLIVVTVYNLVGAFGYLTFGSEVKADILTSYYPIDIPIIVAMTMVAVKAMLTYPVVFFCARLVLMDVFGPWCQRYCGAGERTQRVLLTVTLFAVILILALVVPNIGALISLLGGTSALFIFGFPGVCYMQAHANPRTNSEHIKRALGIFFMVLCAFLFGSITAQSIYSYISGDLTQSDVLCQ